jgi:hypothetical protein
MLEWIVFGRPWSIGRLIVVYSVDVLTSIPAGFLCVLTLKLQLEKTSGAAKASKRIKDFFMAFNFARKEGPAQWDIQPTTPPVDSPRAG